MPEPDQVIDTLEQLQPCSAKSLAEACGCDVCEVLVALSKAPTQADRTPPPAESGEHAWWWQLAYCARHPAAQTRL